MLSESAGRLMEMMHHRKPRRFAQALLLVAGLAAGTGAGVPIAAGAAESPSLLAAEQRQQRQRFTGVWALVDNANNLFNVRLSADGRALSTSGKEGTPLGGSENLRPAQLFERGRWQPWGNGVRIDYSDGWTDAIVTGPEGPVQWSWAPGTDRLQPPTNHGKAVQVRDPIAVAVGVYRFRAVQDDLPPTTLSLLSNGLAFNSVDRSAGGVWRLRGNTVLIEWASGWRAEFEPRDQGPLRARIWQPGSIPPSPPTAVRTGERVD
ncbi:hypothetical protein KBY96_06080 [Cyanobium sp. ATX 6A2]|uniref:hypothetical protein n=1 Tax=Cyanobium sp. ATX 6A2 TaxID=2823700 RepID=UPI0020CC5B88|nr:hypothetical protein [Cyanobium sp. ATX 6A2]MCP9887503.1 hypothetical protein [Cyanobium sp. ATX 6A2]